MSLVAHPRNPHVPAVHINTRYLNTHGKRWFGGGADLTPIYPCDQDTDDFHACLKACCDAYQPHYYAQFSAWCDDYFTLKHRQEKRGLAESFMIIWMLAILLMSWLLPKMWGEHFCKFIPNWCAAICTPPTALMSAHISLSAVGGMWNLIFYMIVARCLDSIPGGMWRRF